jgi:tetratricopeptide (TPR) repeat protein
LLGEWEQAQDHYQIALDGLPDQHSLRIQVLVDWSLMYLRMGDSSKAEQLANQALLLAEHLAEPRSLAQAHNLLGILNRHLQRPALAREHLEQSLSLAEQLGGLSAQAAALNNLALVSGDQGENQCAQQLAEQALALCITLGDRHQEAAVRSNLADLLRAGGDEPAALEQLKQAVAIFAQIGADTGEWQPEIWKLVEF